MNYWRDILRKYSKKQKKIMALTPPEDEFNPEDFEELREGDVELMKTEIHYTISEDVIMKSCCDDCIPHDQLIKAEVKRTKKGKIVYRGEIFPAFNMPKRAPKGSPKKYRVLARVYEKGKSVIRIVNFGFRGMKDFLQHKDPKRRRNFKSRMNCKDKKNKLTAGWWACNFNW